MHPTKTCRHWQQKGRCDHDNCTFKHPTKHCLIAIKGKQCEHFNNGNCNFWHYLSNSDDEKSPHKSMVAAVKHRAGGHHHDNIMMMDVSRLVKGLSLSDASRLLAGVGSSQVLIKQKTVEIVQQGSPAAQPTAPPRGPVQVGISFDTTGSMYPFLEAVRQSLKELNSELFDQMKNVEVSMLAHGDYCDKSSTYVDKYIPFVKDEAVVEKFVDGVGKTSGGDGDECYELALRRYNRDIRWHRHSTTRSLILIGDARPHEKGYTYDSFTLDIDWNSELEKLKKLGVTIYAVQCGSNHSADSFYRKLAVETGGAHLRLDMRNPSDVVDTIMAACLKQAGEQERLAKLKAKAERSGKQSVVQTIRIIEKVLVRRIEH